MWVLQAEQLKQQGVTVISVGVGDQINKGELTAIATDPSHVFVVSDYNALTNLHTEIKRRTCSSQLTHACNSLSPHPLYVPSTVPSVRLLLCVSPHPLSVPSVPSSFVCPLNFCLSPYPLSTPSSSVCLLIL